MGKGRLEALSDGVIAIIITIMVLEFREPTGHGFADLAPLMADFLCYVLSFIYVGIYWNNHHHMLHAAQRVNGRVLWNNLHLLFWLSLIPFVTRWTGETHFSTAPVSLYGVVLLMAAIAYTLLTRALIHHHGKDSTLSKAIGGDMKGKLSLALYAMAIPLAFLNAWIAFGIYCVVAILWFIPDQRIEKMIS